MKTNDISYIDTYNFKKLMVVSQLITGSTFVPESSSFFVKNLTSGSVYYINEIEIHNTNTTTSGSIRLFLNESGSLTSSVKQQLLYLTMTTSETFWLESANPYVLSYGDSISGISNVSNINVLAKGTSI